MKSPHNPDSPLRSERNLGPRSPEASHHSLHTNMVQCAHDGEGHPLRMPSCWPEAGDGRWAAWPARRVDGQQKHHDLIQRLMIQQQGALQ